MNTLMVACLLSLGTLTGSQVNFGVDSSLAVTADYSTPAGDLAGPAPAVFPEQTPPGSFLDPGGRRARNLSWSQKLDWGDRLQGPVLRLPAEVASHVRKRFVVLGALQPDEPHQRCVAPGDESGRCRHLQYCILDDFKTNFPRFLDYLCVIERSYVGVCCPERSLSSGLLGFLNQQIGGLIPGLSSVLGRFTTTTTAPVTTGAIGGSAGTPQVSAATPDASTGSRPATVAPPDKRGCGMSSMTGQRIVGGQPARLGQWPWMVALIKRRQQYCGGTLLTDRHVLTAAHCIVRVRPSELRVRLGEYDLGIPDETRTQEIAVTDIRRHEDYNAATYENDIAVLRLQRVAVFGTYVWPACLPPPGNLFENRTAVVVGWGTLYYGGPSTHVLMEVAIPVWRQQQCVGQFTQPIVDTMLCAGAYEGGRDSCQGDSGGPLLLEGAGSRWAIIGIVSWGIRCGDPGRPGIYTRVNRFLPWIESKCRN